MSCPFFCYLMARRLNLLMSVMACISFTQRSRLLYGCSKWWINCMAAANGGLIVWLQQMVPVAASWMLWRVLQYPSKRGIRSVC